MALKAKETYFAEPSKMSRCDSRHWLYIGFQVYAVGSGVGPTWVPVLALPLNSCAVLSMLLNPSTQQMLRDGNHSSLISLCICCVFLLVSQSYLTVCNPVYPARFLCPWDSLGKNTGGGFYSLFQRIFLTQGLNLSLPHCSQILDCLSHHVGGKHIPQMVRDVFKALPSSCCDFYPYHHTWRGGKGSAQPGPLWALQLPSHQWMGTVMVSTSTGLLTGLFLLREREGK